MTANQFRHQYYPTQPALPPALRKTATADSRPTQFSRLHTQFAVRDVLVVHGTFMGDDPFGIGNILQAVGQSLPPASAVLQGIAAAIQQKTKSLADSVTGDVGNYTPQFVQRFQDLVNGDPDVELLQPTWTGQNHHFARADLAVRLFCRLLELDPTSDAKVLLWGHSHAGNGFAILSNLLANERDSVEAFFEAAGEPRGNHWKVARQHLAASPGPHPLARSVIIATFGTPVRYGWDCSGFRHLTHFLHHRNFDDANPFVTKPLFPAQSLPDTLSARFGDWVQAFAIAGTDVATPASSAVNQRLATVLEAGLEEPTHALDTRFLIPRHIRDVCARWKTGTRCHADGRNLLLDYEPCGRLTLTGQVIEESLLGHGVATTLDWLPTHLSLLLDVLEQDAVDGRRGS